MTDSQRILDSIRRLVRVLRLMDRAAQTSAGLSSAQLFVLNELGKTPSLSLNELSERTRTDQSSVSVVVARLADAGLVARQRASDDGRKLALTLTNAGRTKLRNAPRPAQEQLLSIFERMPDAERKHFADTFTFIVEAMGASEGVAPMLFEDEARPRRGPRDNA